LELPWPTSIPIDQKPLNRYFPLRGLPSRPACARNPYNLHLPAYLLFEAELYGEAGRYEDELRLLDTAHDVMDTHGQLACEAELYRLRGSALLARGARSEEVERCYERSAEITRRQSARNSGNCAPPSAAPVSGAIKGSGSRRDMLANVYGWFTEGFDTRDLKESKALLEALDA
jgi:hypothetical protein